MVFYMDTKGIDTIDLVKPTEDQAYLLVSEFKHLYNLNIKEFNYYVFEEDIDKMSPGEFEWWFKSAFEPWLQEINEDYLDIEYEEIRNKFEKQDEKKLFLKKMIHFIMFYLPYQLTRDLVKANDSLNSIEELEEYLRSETNLLSLRGELMRMIDFNMNQTDTFVDALVNFEKISKKNLLDTSVELLDEHIKKQNFFLNIFKDIIEGSDMEKISRLLQKYIEFDRDNLL